MSALDLVTMSNQEAKFISSAVLQILDQKQADQFVKSKLMENANISRITREEISAVVTLQDVSSNSDASRSTTDVESSFHSILSDNEQQSPTTTPPVKTPTKTKPPRLPSLRQQQRIWKEKFKDWDQSTTELALQLVQLGAVPSTLTLIRPGFLVCL